jgi:hypothetical protein
MKSSAVVLPRTSWQRACELLRSHGFTIDPQRPSSEFEVYRCQRDGVAALLGLSQPAHWTAATDERRDLVVLAAMCESLFRFWRLGRESRLCREIVELLQPLRWVPPAERG